MLIAVSEDVAKNDRLVDRIKEVFTAASSYLYQVTRKRAYFKDITILLPSSWRDRPEYNQPISESEDKSDVLIDQPDSSVQLGDRPFTVKTTPCGELGHFIHLSPAYLLDTDVGSQFGPYDKALIHEWAHLRYGVYDEYPDASIGPHFYAGEGGQVEGVRCSLAITGQEWDVARQREGCDYTGGMPDPNCRFRPNPQPASPSPHGSLLYHTGLDQVMELCDHDPEKPFTLHNARAPNLHNSLCGERSVWEVLESHQQLITYLYGQVLESHGDFERDFNPPRNVSSTVPEFRVVKRRSKRTVLVLDTSGSMSTNNRIQKLAQAATNYLRHVALDGERVGIVWFDLRATIKSHLVEINNATRVQLVASVPLVPNGATSIGDGLLKGLEVLSPVTGNFTPGGNILLVSDGVETHAPWIRDVIIDVLAANVTVDTVAVGTEADKKLEELAAVTGGRSYFHPDTGNSNALQEAFVAMATRDTPLIKQTVTLLSTSVILGPGQSLSEKLPLDSSVGGATELTVAYTHSPPPNLTLVTPGGQVIDSTSPEYNEDSIFNLLTIRLSRVETGTLQFTVANAHQTNSQSISVTLTSRYNAEVTSPIVAQARWGRGQVNFPGELQTLFVSVSKGYAPLLNAEVRATLESPANSSSQTSVKNLTLRDNGAGADSKKDDGIYSAYVTSFTADGRYYVRVEVKEKPTSRVANDRLLGYGAPADSYAPSVRLQTSGVEPFRRFTSPGSFSLSGFVPGEDVYPPSKITDLRVGGLQKGEITLIWTAPGDDYDDGKAQLYRMWFDTDFERLRTNHSLSTPVSRDIVLEGLLQDPWQAGSTERVVVAVPDSGDVTYYFVVEAVDDAQLVSPRSNIASATLRHLPSPSNWLVVVVVTSVVVSFVLLIMAVGLALYCHRKRKSKVPSNSQGIYTLEHASYAPAAVFTGSGQLFYTPGTEDTTRNGSGAYDNEGFTKPTFF